MMNDDARPRSLHFLFGGLRTELPPFDWRGEFGSDIVPEIQYFGDNGDLELPIGTSGRRYAVTIPGDLPFLGDLDGDGLYPDVDAFNRFGVLEDVYLALVSNDQAGLGALIDRHYQAH